MVEGVGNDDIAIGINRRACRESEARIGGWAVCKAPFAVLPAGDCAHRAIRSDHADAVVVLVGHEDIAIGIDCNASRAIEARISGWAVYKATCEFAPAGDCAHRVIRSDLADAVVEGVGNDDIAIGIDRYASRAIEACISAWAVCIAPADFTTAGDCAHSVIRSDHADAVVALVGHEDIPIGIDRYASRAIEARISGWAVYKATFTFTRAGDGAHGGHSLRL
jgi:hypothetical protein